MGVRLLQLYPLSIASQLQILPSLPDLWKWIWALNMFPLPAGTLAALSVEGTRNTLQEERVAYQAGLESFSFSSLFGPHGITPC